MGKSVFAAVSKHTIENGVFTPCLRLTSAIERREKRSVVFFIFLSHTVYKGDYSDYFLAIENAIE